MPSPVSSAPASAARALRTLWAPGTASLSGGPGCPAVEAHGPLPGDDRVDGPVGGQDEVRGGLGEAPERRRQLGQRRPARMVVELDVGDHRDLGTQLEEAGVRLVGLGDHPLGVRLPARAHGLAVGAQARELAAEHERAPPGQQPGEHPGRRGLAVGAGDGDQPLAGAELGEQLAPVDHPLAALARPGELGVVVADRARDDHVGARRARRPGRGRRGRRSPRRRRGGSTSSRPGRCRSPGRPAGGRRAPGRSSRHRRWR